MISSQPLFLAQLSWLAEGLELTLATIDTGKHGSDRGEHFQVLVSRCNLLSHSRRNWERQNPEGLIHWVSSLDFFMPGIWKDGDEEERREESLIYFQHFKKVHRNCIFMTDKGLSGDSNVRLLGSGLERDGADYLMGKCINKNLMNAF